MKIIRIRTKKRSGSATLVPCKLEANNNRFFSCVVQVVKLEKTSEPLGATVKNEGEAVVVGRIIRGGAADRYLPTKCFGSESRIFLNTDPDPDCFSIRIRIQVKKKKYIFSKAIMKIFWEICTFFSQKRRYFI